jgi:hypothetical protein
VNRARFDPQAWAHSRPLVAGRFVLVVLMPVTPGLVATLPLSLSAYSWAGAAPVWEPGKVVSVEQVSSPAKKPDPSCRAVPRGTTPPTRCRPSFLRAEQFWRVTVDVGNKRYVVRPYHEPSLIDALSQDGTVYVDPNLTAASSVEVAVLSNKAIRLRSDPGPGMPAIVDSQELISKSEAPLKVELPSPSRPKATAPFMSNSKVVLLESSDFADLEVQEIQSQDIGDGVALYSFSGDSSQTKIHSNPPVFLVLAESEAAMGDIRCWRAFRSAREPASWRTPQRFAAPFLRCQSL